MGDIFNGLLDAGLEIQQVEDLSRNVSPNEHAPPGSWAHEGTYVGGSFVVVARKRP